MDSPRVLTREDELLPICRGGAPALGSTSPGDETSLCG